MRDRTARGASSVGRAIVGFAAAVIRAIAVTVAGGFFLGFMMIGLIALDPAAADGEVTIEVMANGQPADTAPGPTVESGAKVNLRYVVTVGSSEPLYDFVVSNLTGDVSPNCDTDGDGKPDGADGHPGPLSAGDSFFCVLSFVAADPGITYASVGRVTAYDFDATRTFVHDDAAHYTTVSPTTTQAPTTQAPTTAAPATAAPTTAAPTTAAPTTTSTTTSTTSTNSSSSTSTPSSRSSSTSPFASTSTTTGASSSAGPIDEDAAPPDELAAIDEGSDSGGFPLWWVVLAFATGGGIAVGVSSHLAGRSAENAAVPDQ